MCQSLVDNPVLHFMLVAFRTYSHKRQASQKHELLVCGNGHFENSSVGAIISAKKRIKLNVKAIGMTLVCTG